jgi:Cell wall-active antibiotics response 4TMS YvqF
MFEINDVSTNLHHYGGQSPPYKNQKEESMATNQSTNNQNTPTPTTGNNKSSNRPLFIGVGLILLAVIALFGRSWFGLGGTKTETISQELDTAKQAEIFLTSGINVLRVSEGSSNTLIVGKVDISSREKLEQNFEMKGDTAVFRLESKGVTNFFPWFSNNTGRNWDVQLSPTIPLALTLKAGIGEVHLDLSKLNLTDLELSTGVGTTTIELPATGQIEASIEVGVGEITIHIPKGMAARIEAKAGIGNVKVSENLERDGDEYVSSDYDTATNRVYLKVTGGIGQVTVETSQ